MPVVVHLRVIRPLIAAQGGVAVCLMTGEGAIGFIGMRYVRYTNVGEAGFTVNLPVSSGITRTESDPGVRPAAKWSAVRRDGPCNYKSSVR